MCNEVEASSRSAYPDQFPRLRAEVDFILFELKQIELSVRNVIMILLVIAGFLSACQSNAESEKTDHQFDDVTLLLVGYLGDVDQYLQEEYGLKSHVTDWITEDGHILAQLPQILEIIFEDDARLINSLKAMFLHKQDKYHDVMDLMQALAQQWHLESVMDRLQQVDLLHVLGTTETTYDDQGNPIILTTIETEKLIEEIRSTDSQIIVLPFTLGQSGMRVKIQELREAVGPLTIIYQELNGTGYYIPEGNVTDGQTAHFVTKDGQVLVQIQDQLGFVVKTVPALEIQDYVDELVVRGLLTQQEAQDFDPKVPRSYSMPLYDVFGAYDPDHDILSARANLLKLIEICNKFPERTIIATVGNNSDITSLRTDLQAQGLWPENLVMAAGCVFSQTPISQRGADTYVDGVTDSEATGAIALTLADLLERGLTVEQALSILRGNETSLAIYEIEGNGAFLYDIAPVVTGEGHPDSFKRGGLIDFLK